MQTGSEKQSGNNKLKAMLSRSRVQFGILGLLSFTLAFSASGPLAMSGESWYAFHTSIIHGFSALAGICLMAGFFFYERIEIHIENLKYACASAARKLKRGQLGLFDESTMLALLQDTKKRLDSMRESLDRAESEERKQKLAEDWSALFSSYIWVYETLKEIAFAERKRSIISTFTKDYFVPMFIPIIISIVSISFTDVLRSNAVASALMMYLAMFITVFMILRLVHGSIWGGWNEFMTRGPDPSDFILNSLAILEDPAEWSGNGEVRGRLMTIA
jgi:hypothetical protein